MPRDCCVQYSLTCNADYYFVIELVGKFESCNVVFHYSLKDDFKYKCNNNKSAQSNLGRGPRRGTVAHVRRKVPIGYNGAPQIRPQKYPFPWTDPQTPLPASSLDPSDLRCQTASGSDPPFFHNALDRPTHQRTYGPTHRPTDRSRESFMTIGRCATTATRPNNINVKTAVL